MTSRQKWFGASSIVAMGLVLSAGFAGLHWGSSRETAQLRVDWKEGGGKYNVVTGQVADLFGHPIALLKVTLGCDDGKNSTITDAGGHLQSKWETLRLNI